MSNINVLPFYRSYWEALKDLSDTNRLKLYDAIFNFVFKNEEPKLTGLPNSLWILLRPNIDKSVRKTAANSQNGKKGGRPSTETQTEPTENPTETQTKPHAKPTKKADIYRSKEQGVKNKSKEQGVKSEEKNVYKKRFCPPTLEDVKAYCSERNNSVDAERFFDYYSANGWVQGKDKPIKDWKACVRTWEKGYTGGKTGKAESEKPSFDLDELEKRMKESDGVI